MLRRIRKSSRRVTLVLIGVGTLAACGGKPEEMRRDVYATREDCLADWANKPEDCTPATERRHSGLGFFYGPLYSMAAANALRGGGGWGADSARPGSRAIGGSTAGAPSRSVTRGGFGGTGRGSGG